MNLKIAGIGKCLPKKCVSNEDLTSFLDTNDEWIVSRTGVQTRYICTDESMTDLSAAAALQALQNAGITASDVDLIIGSTLAGDFRTPSLACTVAERIGAQCTAFDLNGACAGFIYSLEAASLYLNSDKYERILIVCCEMMSKHVDWTDRNTCILFGDGAAACLVTKGDAIKYIHTMTSPTTKPLQLPTGRGNNPFKTKKNPDEFLYMAGQDVFRFAVGTVESEMSKALELLDMKPEDIDYYVLHQANKRIINAARNKVKQPEEKFPVNVHRYGNMSSVTIPLLLLEMLEEGKLKTGHTLFMAAFGAGLTFGSCVMVWE